MSTSLHNVDVEFYKQWLGDTLSSDTLILNTHKNTTATFKLRYGYKSSFDYAEENEEKYPVLAFIPLVPKVRKDLLRPFHPYYSALRDTDGDNKLDTVTAYEHPVPMDFVYEVHTACKSEAESDAIRNYVYKTFGFDGQKHFLFNKFSVPLVDDSLGGETNIGEPVYYDLETTDIPRSDGLFQTLFTFRILVWVDIKTPADFDLLQQININTRTTNDTTGILTAQINQPTLN